MKPALEQLKEEDRGPFKELLPFACQALGHNPRAIIRFVNNILVDAAIYQSLPSSGNVDGAPLEMFAVTRILQYRWPIICSQLIANAELAKEVAALDLDNLGDASKSGRGELSDLAGTMLIDRQLRSLFGTQEGKKWLTQSEKRNEAARFYREQRRERETEGRAGVRTGVIELYDFTLSDNSWADDLAKSLGIAANAGIDQYTFYDVGASGSEKRHSLRKRRTRAVVIIVEEMSASLKQLQEEVDSLVKRASMRRTPIFCFHTDQYADSGVLEELPPELKSDVLIHVRLPGEATDRPVDHIVHQVLRRIPRIRVGNSMQKARVRVRKE